MARRGAVMIGPLLATENVWVDLGTIGLIMVGAVGLWLLTCVLPCLLFERYISGLDRR